MFSLNLAENNQIIKTIIYSSKSYLLYRPRAKIIDAVDHINIFKCQRDYILYHRHGYVKLTQYPPNISRGE